MPLTDLARHLNDRSAQQPEGLAARAPFIAGDGKVYVDFAGIRLHSLFLPVIDTHSGKLHGHAARLRAIGLSAGTELPPETVFVLPTDDNEFIQLDRLVRTLHALNYLTQPLRGNLLLPVHQRHVLSVRGDHGLAFEEILRPCGLLPEQITLEIDFNRHLQPAQVEHLGQAVSSYQRRGYSLALRLDGYQPGDDALLQRLHPDILRLLPTLAETSPPSDWSPLFPLARQLGARILMDNWQPAEAPPDADLPFIDLIQARQKTGASLTEG